MKTVYELWHSKEANSYTLFPSESSEKEYLEDDAKLIWTVEAVSWDEAQSKKHEYLGWEPYKPYKY